MRKNHLIQIMVTENEKQRIKQKAADLEMNLSSYVRMVCLKSTVEVKTTKMVII